ncbi:hypothetical protein C4D60_Mb06t35190 [Musa balbisiana]|uniref:Centromere protein C n=1 Tax=Musa balbisiana TaxID=52838 RepID=A0A4S8IT29_MUSBA|nr:hypothetical protein C4D60_Mb06t35190 [Musa balbisiana]
MAVDLGSCSAIEDPFADFSLLSLLPRTLGGALRADPPPLDAHETEVIKALLDSVVGSKEVLEQAHAINNSCQNVVNSSQDGNKTIPADVKNRLVSRRPALGRKRAQFSLKSISSNPVPDVDFNSQIDRLNDPEEFFFAFEQLENAGKELKKLRGEVVTEPAKNQQVTGRKRRLGILGKTVSYKHHFSATVDTAEAFSVSQEVLDQRNATPSKASIKTKPTANLHPTSFDQPCNLHSTDTNNIHLLATEREADENNANNLLEKLLFSFRDLDEGEGTAFLRESLQIKSIEIGKIHLPELHSIQRNNFRALENRVAKEKSEAHQLLPTSATQSRSPLADTSYSQRHMSLIDQQGSPYMIPPSADAPYSTSRTPARSPLAAITNFQWRISVDEPLEDPYMIPPSDDAPYSTSRTPARSPLAAITNFQWRISVDEPLEDPYMIPPSDDAPYSTSRTPARSPLAAITNFQWRISVDEPLEDPYMIPPSDDAPYSTSRTPARSPLAAITNFQWRISVDEPLEDPYMIPPSDDAPYSTSRTPARSPLAAITNFQWRISVDEPLEDPYMIPPSDDAPYSTSRTPARSPLAAITNFQWRISVDEPLEDPYMIPPSDDAPYSTSRTPARSPLAAITNFQWRISVDEPLEDPYMIPPSDDAPYSTSRTPARSPLAAITNFQWRISVDEPLEDPYMIPPSDDAEAPRGLVDKLQISVAKADKTVDDKIATEEDVIEHVHCSPESTIEHRDHLMTDDLSKFDGFNEQMEEGNRVQLDPLYERPDHDVEDPASVCSNQCSRDGPDSKRESTAEDHIISESDTVVDKCDADDNLQNQISDCLMQTLGKCGAPDVLVVDAEAPRVLAHSTAYPDADDPTSGCSNHCSRDGPDSKRESTAEDHIISESDTVVDKCDADDNLQNQVNVGAPDVLVVDAEAPRVLAHSTAYPDADDPTSGCSNHCSRDGPDSKRESTAEDHIISESDTVVDKCDADDNLQNQCLPTLQLILTLMIRLLVAPITVVEMDQIANVNVGAPDVLVVDAEASRVLAHSTAYPDIDDPTFGCSNHCSRDGPDSKRESTAEDHIISESDTVVDKCDADDNLQNQISDCLMQTLVLAHSTAYPDADDPTSGCSNHCSRDGPDSNVKVQLKVNVGAPDVLVVDAEAPRVLAHSTAYPDIDDPTFGCSNQISRYGSDNKLESTTEGRIVRVGAPDVMVVDAEASRVLPVNEQSKDVHALAGGNMEAQSCHTTSGLSQNIEKKQKALPSRKDKQKLVSRRQSLADAGMIWNSGVRRSTRIKSRPLEYWRGERFLYGRIHDSLATVIGVKRSSPGNNGKLKVTSFVSEEYADLVAQAAQL